MLQSDGNFYRTDVKKVTSYYFHISKSDGLKAELDLIFSLNAAMLNDRGVFCWALFQFNRFHHQKHSRLYFNSVIVYETHLLQFIFPSMNCVKRKKLLMVPFAAY